MDWGVEPAAELPAFEASVFSWPAEGAGWPADPSVSRPFAYSDPDSADD